jgi:cell division protein FtsW (lipid II flippase)
MDLVAGKAYPAERRPVRHIDGLLLLSVAGLMVSGLFMVYSATHQSLAAIHLDPGTFLKRQATFAALGMFVIMLVASFDYRFLKVYAGIVYGASLALLVLVRTPLGTTVKGSQRWFQLAGFQLTPSELAKIALILMLAAFCPSCGAPARSLAQDVYRATAIAALRGAVPPAGPGRRS